MSIIDLVHDRSNGADQQGDARAITTKQFLNVVGSEGYTTPAELISYCKSLRISELKQLEQLFNCLKSNDRIANYTVATPDKGGRDYTFINIAKTRGTMGLKLIMESGIDDFFIDYVNGEVAINFTLEELVAEAKTH